MKSVEQCIREGNYEEAIGLLKQAEKERGLANHQAITLIHCYVQTKRPRMILETVLHHGLDLYSYARICGNLFKQRMEYEKAIEMFEFLQDDVEVAKILVKTKQFEQALSMLRPLDSSPKVEYLMYECHNALGNIDDALIHLQKGVDTDKQKQLDFYKYAAKLRSFIQ